MFEQSVRVSGLSRPLPSQFPRPRSLPAMSVTPPPPAGAGEADGGPPQPSPQPVAPVMTQGPQGPLTPPDLHGPRFVHGRGHHPERNCAGGRSFVFPCQDGPPVTAAPGGIPARLLDGGVSPVIGRFTITEMQKAMWDLLKLVVMTDRRLEAAMGRSYGNRLCQHPEMLPAAVQSMCERFEVPYSLHEIGHVCLLIWQIGSHMYGKPWVCTSICSRKRVQASLRSARTWKPHWA